MDPTAARLCRFNSMADNDAAPAGRKRVRRPTSQLTSDARSSKEPARASSSRPTPAEKAEAQETIAEMKAAAVSPPILATNEGTEGGATHRGLCAGDAAGREVRRVRSLLTLASAPTRVRRVYGSTASSPSCKPTGSSSSPPRQRPPALSSAP